MSDSKATGCGPRAVSAWWAEDAHFRKSLLNLEAAIQNAALLPRAPERPACPKMGGEPAASAGPAPVR